MKVALIQTRTPATHAGALAEVEPLIRDAARQGAKLVATPECSNLVQRDRSKLKPALTLLEQDPVVTRLRQLARELDIEILVGSALVRRDDGEAANRAVMIAATGDILATYDKIHMFDVDLPTGERARESEAYRAGAQAVLVETRLGATGLTICYDMRFPQLYRALAKAGAQVIFAPAAFTRPTGAAHWHILLRARAIECGAFVLAPAQGGFHEDGRGTHGHSLAVAPWGEIIGELNHDDPGVLVVDLDLSEVARVRAAVPALANDRPFAAPELIRARSEAEA